MKFSIKDYFNKYEQIFSVDLMTFTEETLTGKTFLCSEIQHINEVFSLMALKQFLTNKKLNNKAQMVSRFIFLKFQYDLNIFGVNIILVFFLSCLWPMKGRCFCSF